MVRAGPVILELATVARLQDSEGLAGLAVLRPAEALVLRTEVRLSTRAAASAMLSRLPKVEMADTVTLAMLLLAMVVVHRTHCLQ